MKLGIIIIVLCIVQIVNTYHDKYLYGSIIMTNETKLTKLGTVNFINSKCIVDENFRFSLNTRMFICVYLQ